MGKAPAVLGAFFEDPFWTRVLKRVEVRRVAVYRITFSPGPEDYEVHGLLAKEYYGLRFSPAMAAAVEENRKNPKRMRHQVGKKLREPGLGTKAQQVLRLQREQIKTGREAVSRESKETKAIHQFGLKQQKEKERHGGR